MIIRTIKVTDKGQISIPKEIRELTNICRGDELLIVEKNGKILIEKTDNFAKKFLKNFSHLINLKSKNKFKK